MVIPARTSPRPQWGKSGSWRLYIKVSSRKLLVENLELPIQEREQRRAKFDEANNTTQDIPVLDSSQNEVLWYQKSDYEMFEKDRQLTALQYRTITKRGAPFIEREYSVRGLEELLACTEELQPTGSTRADHVRRVLEEQNRQRRQGTYPDTTMLRDASCRSSREARQRSAQLGEADALGGYVSSSRSLQRQISGAMHTLSRKLQP